MTTTIGSTLIDALERTYARACELHPDLPTNVVFITGKGARSNSVTLGHWAVNRWGVREDAAIESERVHELFIGGECLAEGALAALTTVLHEAAHGLATVRDIKEVSRQNRYHNKKFVALAEELGLHYPHDAPDPTIGYSAVELSEGTAERYDVDSLDRAIQVAIEGGALSTAPAPKKPRTVAVVTFEDGDEVELSLSKYEALEHRLTEHIMQVVTK